MIVTGFENIEYFRDFKLRKRKNSHTTCQFIAQNTRNNAAPNYEDNNELIGRKVQIYAADSISAKNEDNYIMSGVVKSVEFISEYTEDLMKVTIISNSHSLENGTFTRVFQDTKKTVRDVLTEIESSIEGKFVYLDSDIGREEINPIILQYRETNKDFIEKMAEYLKTGVWYDDKSSEEFQIRIGRCREGSALEINKSGCRNICKTYTDDRIVVKVAVTDYQEVNYLDIGQCFRIDGKDFVVEEMNIFQNRQGYVYEFVGLSEAEEKEGIKSLIFPTTSFLVRVTSQDDPQKMGRIQVDFSTDGIESIQKDNPIWLDVDTIYDGVNGGCVFVPDVGDYVDVLFSQNHVFVLGVRRLEALDEKHQNVSEKCIVDDKGRKIVFADKYLELSAANNCIQISEETIKIISDNVILQIENGKVSGNVSDSQFEMNDDIKIHSKNVHYDTDEKLEFNTSQQVTIESKSITLTASREAAITGNPVALNS